MRVEVGLRYRVLSPFLGLEPGDELECIGQTRDPHASAEIWSFRRISDGTRLDLTDLADDHIPVLRDLDRYLDPILQR